MSHTDCSPSSLLKNAKNVPFVSSLQVGLATAEVEAQLTTSLQRGTRSHRGSGNSQGTKGGRHYPRGHNKPWDKWTLHPL